MVSLYETDLLKLQIEARSLRAFQVYRYAIEIGRVKNFTSI